MPKKFPKPFFRVGRGWYVQIGKTQVKLADCPKNPTTEKEAWDRYHVVMAGQSQGQPLRTTVGGVTVAEIIDKFLDWCQKHRAGRTYDWYLEHLQNFLDNSKTARLAASELKPFHVVEWADSRNDDWSPAYRRGAIVAVQRPFNWAAKLGYIPSSPIPHIEKPRAQRREQAVTTGDWLRIKASYPEGDPFIELLEFCWETGVRPQEGKRVESRHVDAKGKRVVFPADEAKGKRKARVILLTDRALELLQKQIAERPNGVLFVNGQGRPWKAHAMACRFGRLKKKLGVKFCGTAFRHGFCQRLLERGTDHLTVAELMGHENGRMVATTYSHMNQAESHLRKALNGTNG